MIGQLLGLLGKRIEEVATEPIMKSLKVPPRSSNVGGTKYLQFFGAGLEVSSDREGHVKAIFLYSEGYQGKYKGFPKELPEGIHFSHSRAQVRKALGKPNVSAEATEGGFLGNTSASDRFDRKDYRLFVEYTEGEHAIAVVTLMAPELPSTGGKKATRDSSKKPGKSGKRNTP